MLSIGLVVAFIVTLLLIPSILKITDKKSPIKKRIRKEGKMEIYLKKVSTFTSKNPKLILLITMLVLIAGTYCYFNIKLETNPRNYAPQDLPAIVLFKELNRIVGGQQNYILVIEMSL